MPHIRIIRCLDEDVEVLYINGTKVLETDCMTYETFFEILRDNLGIDAKIYTGDWDDLRPFHIDDDNGMVHRLKDYGDFVDQEDRF